MAKMRIHEFAKELGVSSKDIISCLEKLGESGKSAQSSIEDDLQAKVKSELSDTPKTENSAVKEEAPKKENSTEKTETKNQDVKAASASNDEKSAENPVKKKKSNLIFVSNPHNSQHGGKNSDGFGNKASGTSNNTQNRQASVQYKGQGGFKPQAPQKLIKPNVPRTANVMMNREEEKSMVQQTVKPAVKPETNKNVNSVKENVNIEVNGGQNNQTNKINNKENVQKNQNATKAPSSDSRSNGNFSRDNGRNGENREKSSEKINSSSNSKERDNSGRNSAENRNFKTSGRKDVNAKSNVSIAFGADQKGAGKDNRRDDSDKRRQNNDKHKKDQNFLNEDGFRGGKPVKGAKTVKLEKPTERIGRSDFESPISLSESGLSVFSEQISG